MWKENSHNQFWSVKQLIHATKLELIMKIELSGVHFGPKSYAGFQNQTGAQDEFHLKSQV